MNLTCRTLQGACVLLFVAMWRTACAVGLPLVPLNLEGHAPFALPSTRVISDGPLHPAGGGGVNLAPDAVNDTVSTDEEVPVVIQVLANDADDGALDPTTVVILSGPQNGTALVNPDGSITFTPDAGYAGTNVLVYRLCDNGVPAPVLCDSAEVVINVAAVNDAPIPGNETFQHVEDGGILNGNVSGNDYDLDNANAELSWSVLNGGTAAQYGTLIMAPDGSFTYDPAPNAYGYFTFTYALCDPGNACGSATVAIDVQAVNDPPVAHGEQDNTPVNTALTLNVSANDQDTTDNGNIDVGSITIIDGPDSGAVVINGNGSLTYTPNPGFQGTDTLIYNICDLGIPLPALCDTAVLVIAVNNNDPLIIDDYYGLDEDATGLFNVSANDVAFAGVLDPATMVLIDGPYHGTASVNPDGSLNYTPDPDYFGADALNYELCTDLGACSYATVLITMSPVNDPPVMGADSATVAEDGQVTTDVLGNDNDAHDAPLGGVDPASVSIALQPANGAAVANPDGTITYTPTADFFGNDSLAYAVCDFGYPAPSACDTAWLYLDVIPVADAPVIDDGNGSPTDTLWVNGNEGQALLIYISASDVDGDALDATGITVDPQFGTISGVNDGDTCITYDPQPGFIGNDAFTAVVCDGTGLCDTVVVMLQIDGANAPPQVVDALNTPVDTVTFTTDEDVAVELCLLVNDPDGDPVDITAVIAGPGFGTINALNDGDTCMTYTPDANAFGNDAVQAVVCDGNGGCDTVVVLIEVAPVNDPPVIQQSGAPADTLLATAALGVPITICVEVIDVDGDAVDATSVPYGPFNGGTFELADGDTCFLYAPDPGFNGLDSMLVVVCDSNGGCDTAFVLVDVLASNQPPVITDGGGTPIDTLVVNTPEENPVQVCLDAIDPENMAVDVTAIAAGPSNGLISGLSNGDTCFTYAPGPDFFGNDTLFAVLCDPLNGCDTVVVIVVVSPINDPPVITDQGLLPIDTLFTSTVADVPVDICLDAYDADGDVLDISTVLNGPFNGLVNSFPEGDTCMTYTPDPGFTGTDQFQAVVCDGQGACDTVVVIVAVGAPNIPPIIVDGNFAPVDTLTFTTPEDQPLTVCVQAIDLNGDTLDLTDVFGGPLIGAVSGIADGDTCFLYTPSPDANGLDTMTAVVCDGNGGCDTVVVIIDVLPVNDPPVITDQGFIPIDTMNVNTDQDVPVTICLDAYDADGEALDVVTVVNGPFNGFVGSFPEGDTCFTYTPNGGFTGTDVLEAVVCDGQGGCDTVVVIVQLNTTNIPPIIVDGNFSPVDTIAVTVPEDNALSICINAIDLNGDTLDVTGFFGGPQNGLAGSFNDGDTCFTYTPAPDFFGPDQVSVVVCDGNGGCDTVLVLITVTPVNDPPVILENGQPADTINATTPESTAITICFDASDVENDALDLTSVLNGPDNGTIGGTGDGDTCFTYTPDPDFVGTDTMSVVVCDTGGGCDTVVVIIAVTPVTTNDPPIAVDDAASTDVGVPVTVDVMDNDSDPNGDPITVTSASANNGTVVINGDGTITYTPDPLFCGTDTIHYTICDPGPLCDDAIVVVNVPCPPDNEPPVAVNDSSGTDPGVPITVDVLGNDFDPNGDPLVVSAADAAHGNVVINDDGSLLYTPAAGFCGMDSIVYTICDPGPLCDQGTVFITIACPDTTGLLIPQGFSPNNDGHGDRWTITGLEKYPQASVVIINRWGNEVYKADPYANDWDGRSTNALTWDGVLPVGTYWYVLDLHAQGEEVRTGYIYLNK